MAPAKLGLRGGHRGGRHGSIEGYLEALPDLAGAGAGEPFEVLHWQRRFLRVAFSGAGDAALSVARANGKSTFVAGLGCAAIDGPLRQPRAEVLVVASSFLQARVVFDHSVEFLGKKLEKREVWRVWDTSQVARILHRPSGASLQVIAADPRRMHGRAPVLVLADEPAQWEPSKSERALAALRTGLGKVPGSRLIALGTRPDSPDHWFQKMLKGDRAVVYAARPDDPPFHRRTWRRANPSLDIMPALEERLRVEAEEARRDPVALASFRALRLNQGVSDTVESVLVEAGLWSLHTGDAAAVGPYVLGVDLGTTEAMSAAAGYWPETGRLDALAVYGDDPDLKSRGLRDGVGRLYTDCARRGELLTSPGRVSDLRTLLDTVYERWGAPAAIVCDRWREGELRDALSDLRFPRAALVIRGMGYKDGGEDVRSFRKAVMSGEVTPRENLLLASAMSEARTVSDPAGNAKLAKKSEGGRRKAARDDAAAAAVLAVALAWRRRKHVAGSAPQRLRSVIV